MFCLLAVIKAIQGETGKQWSCLVGWSIINMGNLYVMTMIFDTYVFWFLLVLFVVGVLLINHTWAGFGFTGACLHRVYFLLAPLYWNWLEVNRSRQICPQWILVNGDKWLLATNSLIMANKNKKWLWLHLLLHKKPKFLSYFLQI